MEKKALIRTLHGSLQHEITRPRWSLGDSLYTVIIILITLSFVYKFKWVLNGPSSIPYSAVVAQEPVSPLTANGTITPTPSPQASLQNIVSYVTAKFESEGPEVVIEALNCFYSESKLDPLAKGKNRNSSVDVGIAQVNSVHGIPEEELKQYKLNIDAAYAIYKKRGWDAWYGRGCAKLAYR